MAEHQLQKTINQLETWGADKRLKFSPTKTNIEFYSKTLSSQPATNFLQ